MKVINFDFTVEDDHDGDNGVLLDMVRAFLYEAGYRVRTCDAGTIAQYPKGASSPPLFGGFDPPDPETALPHWFYFEPG